MSFQFTRQGLTGRERVLERALEIMPGAISWTILLGMVALALWKPVLAAVLIIAFDLYWLLRLLYVTFFLWVSYARLSMERTTDWMAQVRKLDDLDQNPIEPTLDGPAAPKRDQPGAAQAGLPAAPDQTNQASAVQAGQRLFRWIHRRGLRALIESGQTPPRSEAVCHLVIVPILNEGPEIYEPCIHSLTQQQFPPGQMLVILAVEDRAAEQVKASALDVQRRYREQFLDLLVVIHPDGLPGEARVKGANATYAARRAAQQLARRGISFERVVVSCFDADTVVSPPYFACLTYSFLACPQRTRASFQPIPVYHNNIWNVPGFARVLDVGSSFFQLVEATNPDQLVTFSSHSMSFQALVEIGYWPVDLVSDDSAVFWKAFLYYEGDYRVVPMYVTVSMDVAASDSWRRTIANVYQQKRRWAWGVENVPLVLRGFLRARRMGRIKQLRHGFKLLEGHISWATWPFLLGVIGWFPAFVAGREFSSSVVYYTAPRITAMIFHLASVSLFTTIVLSVCLLPKAQIRHSFLRTLGLMGEWLLVPVIAVCLSAVPALDAQTRLMLGRYMEFRVTEKRRRGGSQAVGHSETRAVPAHG